MSPASPAQLGIVCIKNDLEDIYQCSLKIGTEADKIHARYLAIKLKLAAIEKALQKNHGHAKT